jgi:SH3-like domain-containing protein
MKFYIYIIPFLVVFYSGVALAERLTVMVSSANIRSGPGTKHEILWRIEKFHPLFILKKAGPWYYFRDFEGDTGWIHKSLVKGTPSVITAKETSNIRSGPGTKYKILFTVEKGIPFKVIKRRGNWINIEHADGDSGWIHKSLIW